MSKGLGFSLLVPYLWQDGASSVEQLGTYVLSDENDVV